MVSIHAVGMISVAQQAAPSTSSTMSKRADAGGLERAQFEPIRPIVAHEAQAVSPLEKFEAFVLRSFVESMLPDADSSYFGTGTAGEVWRSMLAEQIGNEIAAGGGIGIADTLKPDAPDHRAHSEGGSSRELVSAVQEHSAEVNIAAATKEEIG